MARISGNSLTKEFVPVTKLISSTSNPVGTIFAVWHMSRHRDEVNAADIEDLYFNGNTSGRYNELIDYICSCYPEHCADNKDYTAVIREVVKLAIKCDVPASEFVSIEMYTNDASVAWREQMVRNRKIHPWLQTSRTADMESYDCLRLASIRQNGGDEAVKIYDEAVQAVRNAYKALIALGVPSEDIRLQTQGHIHRCMWGMNLRDLLKLVGKRSSWISQATLWGPINADVIDILRGLFGSDIIDSFVGACGDISYHKDENGNVILDSYKYINENDDRYYGRDYQPCDPLYLIYTNRTMPEHTNIAFYDEMKKLYVRLWNDDILKILGWDRNHPENLSKIDRPDSYWNNLN